MNPAQVIRDALAASPFVPFAVCLSDGRKLPVFEPNYLLISRHGRIIWEGNTEDEFATTMLFNVTGIERIRRRQKRAA